MSRFNSLSLITNNAFPKTSWYMDAVAATNWIKLKNLVRVYPIIYVDSDFTIDISDSCLLLQDVKFIGTGKTITVTTSNNTRHAFKIGAEGLNIRFEGVKFVLNFLGYLVSGDGTDGKLSLNVNSFKVRNCDISGYGLFCCFYIKGNESGTQDTYQVWVRETEIIDNTIHDLPADYYVYAPNEPTNYTTCGLFIINQISIESITIEDNILSECGHTVFQMKNRNTYNSRKSIKICRNKLVNSDACWGMFNQNYTYYVFAIAEADLVIYEDNHVEGMKISDQTPGGYGAALYDCYTKADTFIYKNNVWKNNMAFYVTKDIDPIVRDDNNSYMLKCKGCYNVFAKGNKFILEQDFLTRLCADTNITNRYIAIMDCSSDDEAFSLGQTRWEYKNNMVRVPRLRFESEQNTRYSYKFEDNDIYCDYLKGYIIYTGVNFYPYRSIINNKIKSLYTESSFGNSAGSANAYTVTIDGITSYTDGLTITVKINTSNTGASTINVNTLGDVSIRKTDGIVLTSGALVSGSSYTLRYNAARGYFQLQLLDSFRIYYGVGNVPYESVIGSSFIVKDNDIDVPNFYPANYGTNNANAINYLEFEKFICIDNIFPVKWEMQSLTGRAIFRNNIYKSPGISTIRYPLKFLEPNNEIKETVPLSFSVVTFSMGQIATTVNVTIRLALKLLDTSGNISTYEAVLKHTPTEFYINGAKACDVVAEATNYSASAVGEFVLSLKHLSYDALSVVATNAGGRNYVFADISLTSMSN
ncbi:MAG: hypothetical protein FNP40_03735 [Dehalobacter sp. 4CP]|uniref:hypothetical protein n=1 Tax=Dehalobacter sp. CP TaxID=2594474 RepID=UPI0013C5FB83|nr:hypothetical protein [Dehalobacter sp. 4CP]